ncbi:hypothetical protein GCM10012275_19930 [Longimycelium tulufanense]|uniref:Uncharacterized protein n=1 Tax=Longimycelium tulufanense TaxID=907463 RepID=A0A8J3FVZ7_9PSEU|nr:DUF5819 family protein [Longimycelium tulufanense]GGM49029.1 hypothetical protein GCM10012275_19930 [Longimycelium tulufanense]
MSETETTGPATHGPAARAQNFVLLLAALATAGILLIHFGMTVLYNTPTNPVKKTFDPAVRAYMVPVFEQNWLLFAPDPIVDNHAIEVRARLRTAEGPAGTTAWQDITGPALRDLYAQRWWPSRVSRLPASAARQSEDWRDPVLTELRDPEAGGAGRKQALGTQRPRSTEEQAAGRARVARFLRRLASAEATTRWGDAVQAVQVRVVARPLPPFPGSGPTAATEFPKYQEWEWQPVTEEPR